ncbi:MAG TPA: hypothetical protein VFQ45_17130 [Longimicrobium sp.]|nr:hypothetical protein [Longimicrobium sp.]
MRTARAAGIMGRGPGARGTARAPPIPRPEVPGTLFVIEPKRDAAGNPTGYTAWGGGNGHGAGMAQPGAVGMARAGHTYQQILKKYYTGIVLETKNGTRRNGTSPTTTTPTDPYDCTSA